MQETLARSLNSCGPELSVEGARHVQPGWIPTTLAMPDGEVLIATPAGECHIAILVKSDDEDQGTFMDARSADILPWPSHWMRLPPLPLA